MPTEKEKFKVCWLKRNCRNMEYRIGMYYLMLRLGGSLDLVTHWWANSHLLNWEGLLVSGSCLITFVVKQESNSKLWCTECCETVLSGFLTLQSCLCPFILFLSDSVVNPMYCAGQILHWSWYITFEDSHVSCAWLLYSLLVTELVNFAAALCIGHVSQLDLAGVRSYGFGRFWAHGPL